MLLDDGLDAAGGWGAGRGRSVALPGLPMSIFVRVLFVFLLTPLIARGASPVRLPAVDSYALAQQARIVLERSNRNAREAMPLGNGSLGAAVWAEDGMTVQLNRADTLPARLSPGQLVLPGLEKLALAADYKGSLNLAAGEFVEQGGGMRAVAYIESATDALVVEVHGADPAEEQTVELRLWAPRQPRVLVRDGMGVLAETWQDERGAGASGETFGSLAAVHVDAAAVRFEKRSEVAVRVKFRARGDGTYRVVVAAPAWRGGEAEGFAAATLQKAEAEPASTHREWWRGFWQRAAPFAMSSANGEAEYLAQLRAIYLYTAAAEVGSHFPGSQAGVGDLFSSMRDDRHWDPSAYWHWNLRMQVAANLGAGLPELNRSYFALYRENLPAMEAWTKQHMGGRAGACVPETMRFNGKGYENEAWSTSGPGLNCAEDSKPFYNARTLSTGSEVALWIWRQYLETDDKAFLAANYPVMREAARFLLAYSTRDAAGVLHTAPANAHENQWDVRDPLTDIAAMRVVFADVAQAAAVLGPDAGQDAEFARQLREAGQHLPALPQAEPSAKGVVLSDAAAKASQTSVFVDSYEPGAAIHNVENIGLEPAWPYELTGSLAGDAADPLHAVGVRTFYARANKNEADWSYDPVQAAHLGLGDEVRSTLLALTERYQVFPSGMAEFISHDFFVEQIGVLTLTLGDALVQQDAQGRVLVAPAWPKSWDADGTVALEHGVRVRVVVRGGQVAAVAVTPGREHRVELRNPWPRQQVRITGAGLAARLAADTPVIVIAPSGARGDVLLEPVSTRNVAPLRMENADQPKCLGMRMIGLFAVSRP